MKLPLSLLRHAAAAALATLAPKLVALAVDKLNGKQANATDKAGA